MAKTSISVRLDSELGDKLSTVAARLDRPKSWAVEYALKEFIELQLWQFAAIEGGLRDADAGQVVPHEDVVAWVESWGGPHIVHPGESRDPPFSRLGYRLADSGLRRGDN